MKGYFGILEAYSSLINEWNALVRRINALGGEDFLREAERGKRAAPPDDPKSFSREELTKLVALCHPDRHGGCKKAEEMTKKLLEMRGR